jgi:putative transposase
MDKYKNKYKISPIRFQNYDYTSDGAYFVTICTKSSVNYFGHVENGEMRLSKVGVIAENCWGHICEHFDNVILDEYKIMPNHVHGIIIISSDVKKVESELTGKFSAKEPDSRIGLQNTDMIYKNEFGKPIKKSLSVIVNQYKSAVKRECNKMVWNFAGRKGFLKG